MKTWTEEELNDLSRPELRKVIEELAKERNCQPDDILPIVYRGKKDMLIDSILEAQEEVRGQ